MKPAYQPSLTELVLPPRPDAAPAKSPAVPAAETLAGPAALPVWVECPRRGERERYSSLSRDVLYDLSSAGKIKSKSLKLSGQVRGKRLFHLPSILEWIDSQPAA